MTPDYTWVVAGIDAGIGRNADVILGGWSCCRSVNPVVKGCVTLESHSRTSVNCIQCGVTFDVLDNARYRSALYVPVAVSVYFTALWQSDGYGHAKLHVSLARARAV